MCPPSLIEINSVQAVADLRALPSPTSLAAPALTILIVDDDPVVRSLMQDALEDEGFSVIEAEDGVEACRRCEETVPSLLIVDAVMPNMDGFDLCRELRRRAATRHVPILMATGLDDHESIVNAYNAGATDFIAKPLNWSILNHRIRYMLRGAQTLKDLRQNQLRLRASQELEREQSERFEAALGNMSQGLCMFGADGRLIVTNPRFRDMFRLALSSVTPGQSMIEVLQASPLFPRKAAGEPHAALAEHLSLTSRRDSAALTQELANGRIVTITHEPMPGGGFVDTFTDVTQQRLAEAQIAHMALHDPLTDLPNRRLFRQRLETALHRVERGEPCAVLCLDLDQFKGVNDTLGHPVGDALLKAVTDRLHRLVRQADTVARLGGDEFAVVQSSVNQPEDATMFAERLLHELAVPYEIAGHQVVIGVSIGIAIAPEDGADPDLLLRSADIALYQAKSDGRGRYRFFEPAMDTLMQARREMEVDLRKALVGGEFELFFQPLVNLKHEHISGFEALLRWRHPRRGLVSPAEFIPLAEEIGLIAPIGEWVLRNACRHAQSWPGAFKVAVNISAVQFKSRDLVPVVTRALQESGLDPARLELEITESVMVHDFDTVLSMLHQLKQLGISISMDDFGTGNRFAGRPMKSWIAELSRVAKHVVAVGDCATWGGIPATAPNPSDSIGLQFLKRSHGGFLGQSYRSKAGLPVINVPGCPAHPDWMTQIIVALATGRGGDISLDEFQRPKTFFSSFTQTGCTRNMHFSYKVSATEFGQRKGCLFYDLGCRGPMTHSPCNRILWNRQSSKTRAGMPCLGCTEPEFPFHDLAPGTVFRTQTLMGVPRALPTGIDKIGYIKLSTAAKAASPRWAEDDIFVV